jgi:RNA polymerase sigma factor (TIGR02999 family)
VSDESAGEVTRVLSQVQRGDREATDRLLAMVYEELRKLARARLSDEPNRGSGMTLQATALVHEAYLRLVGNAPKEDRSDGAAGAKAPTWQGRGHFFGAAALAMRRILVERARYQKRIKHGGGRNRVDVENQDLPQSDANYDRTDLIALDDAITKLEQLDPRKAKVVTLRYFAGLSIDETAGALDLSPATVKNEWTFARAWLHRELSGEGTPGSSATPAAGAEPDNSKPHP